MRTIAIVGIGQGRDEDLPLSVAEKVTAARHVVVASKEGLAAQAVERAGVSAVSFAELGLDAGSRVDEIVHALFDLAETGDVVLASAGYPFMKEGLVSALLAHGRGSVDVHPTSSPLQMLLLAFDADLTADADVVDARALRNFTPERGAHVLITGVSNTMYARKLAERFQPIYPLDHQVVVAEALPGGGFGLRLSTLAEFAGAEEVLSELAVYVPPSRIDPPSGLYGLVRIVEQLRAPDGCPWDRKQTHASLRQNIIEESYEVVSAIDDDDARHLKEELGDTLLQIALHSQIASEAGEFDIDDVATSIVAKLRRRHPHIFGTADAGTPEEVLHNWEAIKREEKGGEELLAGIAHSLPALMYAQKVSKRVAAVGFDWPSVDEVWDKVAEETRELQATEAGTPEAAEEVGDLLFTVVNVARKMGVDAETALREACEKFRGRFDEVERSAREKGMSLADMPLEEMEEAWRATKLAETGGPPPPGEKGPPSESPADEEEG